MIKFMLGIAIICFTTFCGYFFAQKYRRRKDFFRQLCEFNERFLSEITYYRRPLPDFAASYEYKGDFHNLLTNYFQIAKEQQGIRLSFSQGMLDSVGLTFLRKEEDNEKERRNIKLLSWFLIHFLSSHGMRRQIQSLYKRLDATINFNSRICTKFFDDVLVY